MQEVQEGTTSSEFVEWVKVLELDVNDFHRIDYYLAQIAAEVRRGYVKDPQKVKVEDMVLEFKTAGEEEKKEDKRSTCEESKAFWLGALKLKLPPEGE